MIHFLILFVFILIVFGLLVFIKNLKNPEPIEEVLPYVAKKFFFSKSEQEFFRIFSEVLDKERFNIFTKVRLADFVEVKSSKEEYQGWWNGIRSKHVDFLVWDIKNSKIVLAIEVDGRSHESKKMIKSDTLKNKIFKTIGIPLHRVKVGTDFRTESDKLVQTLNDV